MGDSTRARGGCARAAPKRGGGSESLPLPSGARSPTNPTRDEREKEARTKEAPAVARGSAPLGRNQNGARARERATRRGADLAWALADDEAGGTTDVSERSMSASRDSSAARPLLGEPPPPPEPSPLRPPPPPARRTGGGDRKRLAIAASSRLPYARRGSSSGSFRVARARAVASTAGRGRGRRRVREGGERAMVSADDEPHGRSIERERERT